MTRAAVGLLVAACMLALAPASTAQQQEDTVNTTRHITNWWLPSAVGGFSFGAAMGYSLTAIAEFRPFLAGRMDGYPRKNFQRASWTGAIVGGIAGGFIGAAVDQKLRHGRRVSTLQRRTVRFATVLAGAGIGTGVSYQTITSKPEDYQWDPVQFAWVTALGPGIGAVGGWLVQRLSPYPSAPRSARN